MIEIISALCILMLSINAVAMFARSRRVRPSPSLTMNASLSARTGGCTGPSPNGVSLPALLRVWLVGLLLAGSGAPALASGWVAGSPPVYNGVGVYGQCATFVERYAPQVLGCSIPSIGKYDSDLGAHWIYDDPRLQPTNSVRIANDGVACPVSQDIMVYAASLPGSGGYGHVCIVDSATDRNHVTVVDSNWNGDGVGHMHTVAVNGYVRGWFRRAGGVIPGQPVLVSPAHETWFHQGTQPVLQVQAGSGPTPDHYTFTVFHDDPNHSFIGNPTEAASGNGDQTQTWLGANPAGSYWWTAHGIVNGVSGPDQYWQFRFHINQAPDTPSLASPADGSWTNARNVTLNWNTPNDPMPGPGSIDYHVWIRSAANTWAADTGGPGYQGNSINFTVPGDGDYLWRVSAGDGLDASPASGERRVRVDATPPAGFIDTLYQDGLTVSGKQTLLGWASDATSGVSQVQLLLDGQSMGPVTYPTPRADGNPGFSLFYDFSAVPAGSHTVTLHITDNAGNTCDLKRTVTVIAPVSAPPSFLSAASASAAPVGGQSPIQVTATDQGGPGTGLVYVEVDDAGGHVVGKDFWDNQSFAAGSSRSYSYSWAVPNAPGTYTIKTAIFGTNWGSLLTWNDHAATVTVAGDTAQYNFESGTQGWVSSGGMIAGMSASASMAFAGGQSLAVNFNGTGPDTQRVFVPGPTASAGATITFHVWIPAGSAVTAVQPFTLQGAGGGWQWIGNYQPVSGLTTGAWNTLSVTVPAGAATPLAQVGVEFFTGGPWAGTCYVDTVGW